MSGINRHALYHEHGSGPFTPPCHGVTRSGRIEIKQVSPEWERMILRYILCHELGNAFYMPGHE